MADHAWIKEFPAAVTVCDAEGIILEMNDTSAKTYDADGGYRLVGSNMLDCHPGQSHQIAERLLAAKTRNVYTIEKNGIRKLIYQSPWYREGAYAGFVEISLEIPLDMPHFVRGGSG